MILKFLEYSKYNLVIFYLNIIYYIREIINIYTINKRTYHQFALETLKRTAITVICLIVSHISECKFFTVTRKILIK